MSEFRYRALRADGVLESGRLEAAGRAEALAAVEGRGWIPVRIEPAEAAGGNGPAAPTARGRAAWARTLGVSARRISSAESEDFLRSLASLLAAGVPLSRALDLLAREAARPAAAERWRALRDRVVDGQSLAAAMERAGGAFSEAQTAMVEAGETGGFLDVVLGQIADFMARERDLKARALTAAIYPAVLFALAAGVVSLLMVFFIPRFQRMFEGFDAPLPLLTRAIIGTSRGLRSYGLWLVAGAALGIGALRRGFRDETRRRALERRLLMAPVAGDLARRIAVSRFCRMLGALLAAGVPLLQALRAARRSLGYRTLADLLDGALDAVQKGESLSAALGRGGDALLSRSTLEMISVAEESGRLDRELTRIADEMERALDRRMRTAVALAEPALLFLIAVLIGVIFIGMVLPIFTLQEYIR